MIYDNQGKLYNEQINTITFFSYDIIATDEKTLKAETNEQPTYDIKWLPKHIFYVGHGKCLQSSTVILGKLECGCL